jgi:hypothetical protein
MRNIPFDTSADVVIDLRGIVAVLLWCWLLAAGEED